MSARGDGAGARSTTASSIMRTPKLVSAEPTNTGVDSPARNDGDVDVGADRVEQRRSRRRPSARPGPPRRRPRRRGDDLLGRQRRAAVRAGEADVRRRCGGRSRRAGRRPSPTGHVAGVGRSPIWASISSSSSSGSRPGRSNLLRNVSTGSRRVRQTSNSLRVCASMPLAASSTITTASTAASTR